MIFVTGGTGLIGSHLLYQLLKRNHTVRVLYRHQNKQEFTRMIFGYYPDDAKTLLNKIDWFQGDVLDYFSISEAIKGASQVYHVAGVVSFDRKAGNMMRVNIQGTANVVNACLEQGNVKLCHVSSIAALGDPVDGELIDENVIWKPGNSISTYSISKFRGEMEVWRGINEGLDAVIINPSLIIGPGSWHGAGGPLFTKVYKGLKFYPSGACGFVDVRDVAETMVKITESQIKGERFIVNADNLYFRQFIDLIASALKRPAVKYEIKPWIEKLACAAENARAFLTHTAPQITRSSLRIASGKTFYSNHKILNAIRHQFIPISESVKDSADLFIKELKK